MAVSFIEDDLRFDFGDGWRIMKWDREPVYVDGMRRANQGKGVDFIGIHDARTLFFIEVKDYSEEVRNEEAKGPVEHVFELKVRSTVAALVGARRRGGYPECAPIFDALVAGQKLRLVLWREEGVQTSLSQIVMEKRRTARGSSDIRSRLRRVHWLDAEIMRTSLFVDYTRDIPDLRVCRLPRTRRKKVDQVLEALRGRFSLPDSVLWKIKDTEDEELLDHWIQQAPSIGSPWKLLQIRA
ncbi:MAG: hypothetical protein IT372_08515 [Polyangiaceae bacterium]|nr:hypothetical protein [Polyangiaceae bacterium]